MSGDGGAAGHQFEPGTPIDVRDQVLIRAGILSSVDTDAASALIQQLHSSEFGARQTIFAEGDPGERVYIVTSGKVKIGLKTSGGRENLRAIMGPNDIFGELAVLDPGPRNCSATAVTDVRAVWLDRATLRAWMAQQPVLAEQLLNLVARRLRQTNDELVELASTDVAGRVARQLLLLAQRFGTREGDAVRVRHGLSQSEIAQLVGADRVSVNRALRDFVQRGWIQAKDKCVVIIDPDALARRVTGGAGHYGGPRPGPLSATA